MDYSARPNARARVVTSETAVLPILREKLIELRPVVKWRWYNPILLGILSWISVVNIDSWQLVGDRRTSGIIGTGHRKRQERENIVSWPKVDESHCRRNYSAVRLIFLRYTLYTPDTRYSPSSISRINLPLQRFRPYSRTTPQTAAISMHGRINTHRNHVWNFEVDDIDTERVRGGISIFLTSSPLH